MIGSLFGAFAGLYMVVWVFSWFSKQPSVGYLIALSVWMLIGAFTAKAQWRPVAQTIGTIIGTAVFFAVKYS